MVDTPGHIMAIPVTPAERPEREGAKESLDDALILHPWLRRLWVGGGDSGEGFAQDVKELRPKLDVAVIKRSDTTKRLDAVPKRWVVEQLFGWLMQCHRLTRDYKRTVQSAMMDTYCHDTNHATSARVIAPVCGVSDGL